MYDYAQERSKHLVGDPEDLRQTLWPGWAEMCLGEEEDGHKEIPTGTAVARACIDHVSPPWLQQS